MSSASSVPEPMTVVIVDDTPDLRDLLRLALERSGDFRVVAEAADGRQAVDVVAAHSPDLVLLDIAMPVMDGLEALPLVRRTSPRSTVVMLSGFGASAMTAKALAGGADGYIQKGQPLSSLLTQLRTLIARNGHRPGATVTRIPPQRTQAAEPPAADRTATTPTQLRPAPDHLEEAPIGFLQVRDGDIVTANREAVRLLGDLARAGNSLRSVLPALADHVGAPPEPDSTVVLEFDDPPRRIVATVRQHAPDTVIYLHTQEGDEIELLRRAIGTAAHEIRTPVSVLMGVAETLLLHQAELSEDERVRMLDAIGRQTRLLDSLTADLLAAAQAQHGMLTLQLEPIDPGQVVRTVLADAGEVTLVDDNDRLVLADPVRFQQMLTNLVSNARKYGEPPIVVRLESSEEGVHLHVEDHGQGVPAEFRPHLFQEYQRAKGTTARGTGLGLFVVRALVEAQGGQVSYSPGSTRGSVFTLTLPFAPDGA